MDEEKRKTLGRVIILGLVILGFILLFLWATILNRGTIRITAEAPFTVLTIDGKQIICEKSPCEITQKRGLKDLILVKEEHQSIPIAVTVKLWRTVDIEVEFQINPYIQTISEIPEPEKEITYELIYEEDNHIYKLVDSQDDQERALVYFQKEILSPLIFGSEKGALVIDLDKGFTAYKVDIQGKDREKIEDFDFTKTINGIWSIDGKSFAFTQEDSASVWVLDTENEIHELSLEKDNTKYAWTYTGDLFFITKQEVQSQVATGIYLNEIKVLSSVSDSVYTFGKYHPEAQVYVKIENSSEITQLPNVMVTANNGAMVYFQSGEEKYRLILK